MSAIAPAEKTENLVYLLLPTALATTLAYIISRTVIDGTITIDVTKWPIVIGIVAPLLGVFLYEISLDEWAVKAYYRWRISYNSSNLGIRLAKAHLILETWMNQTHSQPPKPKSDNDYMKEQTELQIQNTVSSYYVRRQLWHIRATFYLVLSMPLYIYTFGNLSIDLNFITGNTILLPFLGLVDFSIVTTLFGTIVAITVLLADTLPRKRNQTSWFHLLLLIVISQVPTLLIFILGSSLSISLLALALAIEISILYVHVRRNSRLQSHIMRLCEYYYWQRLVAMFSVIAPDEYEKTPKKVMVRRELDSLQALLNRGDKSVFFPLWNSILLNMLDDLDVNIFGFLKTIALRLWTGLLYGKRKKIDTNHKMKQLGWLAYYLKLAEFSFDKIVEKYKIEKDEDAETILNRITKDYETNQEFGSLDAKGILDFLPETLLTTDGKESYWSNQIAAGIHVLYNGSEDDHLSNLATTMVTEFSKTEEVGLNRKNVATFLARYAKELDDKETSEEGIFKDRNLSQFEPIYSEIESESEAMYLVIDFLRGGAFDSRTELLEKYETLFIECDEQLWTKVLKQMPSDSGRRTPDLPFGRQIIQTHFKRLFNRFDNTEDKKAKRKHLADVMLRYVTWNVQLRPHTYDSEISNRLKLLDETSQRRLRKIWKDRSTPTKRKRVIHELYRITMD